MTWQNASNAEPPLGIDEPHLPARGKPILVSAIYFADGTLATALSPFGPQIGAEAILPANRLTGHGFGGVFQLHFYLDDLFPRSIGRPISEW